MSEEINSKFETRHEKKETVRELIRFALIALLVVLPIRLFIAQPFIVSGASMVPTFEDGEYLIVDELTYRLSDPKRGDVVVFNYPLDPSKYFIKRIIGLPTETIEIKKGKVTIKNSEAPNGMVLSEPYVVIPDIESTTITLGSDEYFVLGDNRTQSSDSRRWGPLPEKFLKGRPIIRLFPINKLRILPGEYRYQTL